MYSNKSKKFKSIVIITYFIFFRSSNQREIKIWKLSQNTAYKIKIEKNFSRNAVHLSEDSRLIRNMSEISTGAWAKT